MDFINTRRFDLNTLLKTSPLTRDVQMHLSRVYLALTATIAAAAVGSYVEMTMQLATSPTLFLLASLGIVYYLAFDRKKADVSRRMGFLLLFGFLQGLGLGPLIDMATQLNPTLVPTALLSTTLLFGCFSVSAMFAKRRSMLFLGGILSSFMSLLFWTSLLNIFFRTSFPYMLSLYGGLFAFSLYIIYDTQLIIEKRLAGSDDVVGHALDLFIDFAAVFVRILVILSRQEKKKERREKR